MEIVIVVIAVAILGLAALVAAGRFGEMHAEPVRDVYQPPVPDGELSAADLEQIRFGITPLGYDMAQVDELVSRLARELDARDNDKLPVLPPGAGGPQSPSDRLPQSPGSNGGEDLSAWAKK